MRFSSTEKSRRNNEVTVLAIIETLLAMAASVAVAAYTNSLLHIAIGACLAPLLLLRTHTSIALGKRLFEKHKPDWFPIYQKKTDLDRNLVAKGYWIALDRVPMCRDLAVILKFLILIGVSFGVRVTATVACVLSRTTRTIKAIPKNWTQSTCCTDIASPLELVPGTGAIATTIAHASEGYVDPKAPVFGNASVYRKTLLLCFLFLNLIVVIMSYQKLLGKDRYFLAPFFLGSFFGSSTVLGLIPVAVCYFIAVLYRFSLKSTAFLWLPFLFIPDEKFSIDGGLEIERVDAWSKLMRIVSYGVLTSFFAKVFLLPTVIDSWNSLPFAAVLNVWVMPKVIHPWHWAGVFLAVMNLGSYYFFFDKAPRNLKEGTWSLKFVENIFVAIKFFTAAVSIYTIGVGIYLTWQAVLVAKYPEFDWRLFPW
jgi:hypothetical protein